MEVLFKYQQFRRALLLIIRPTQYKAACIRDGAKTIISYVYTLHAVESQNRYTQLDKLSNSKKILIISDKQRSFLGALP